MGGNMTKCINGGCPSAHWCVRFMSEPDPHRQWYSHCNPHFDEDKCDNFIKREVNYDTKTKD